MKHLKEQIIEAVQDATDTVDGTVSIPILYHFLDGILTEHQERERYLQQNMWTHVDDQPPPKGVEVLCSDGHIDMNIDIWGLDHENEWRNSSSYYVFWRHKPALPNPTQE